MTTDDPGATGPVNPADAGGLGAADVGAVDLGDGPSARVGRHTAIMAAGTLASRVLGLARSMLLVTAIGLTASIAAESYSVANKLPNVMFAVLAAGVLNSALVPQIVKSFHAGRERTVHRILTIGGVGMLVATVVLTLTAGIWVRVYSDGWGPDQTALATAFAFWCIPQLFFYGLYTLFGQVLNAREQFGWFMWAPVANNVVAIGGLVTYLAVFGPYVIDKEASVATIAGEWTTPKILLVAAVATLGIAAQALILIPPMIKGGYRWRWVWRGPKGELSVVAKVASWALAAVAVEQVGILLTTRVATAAQDISQTVSASGVLAQADPSIAGVAAWDYALVIFLVPHSLVTISLMTVLFTQMSRYAADGNLARLREVMSEGVRTVGVFTMFAGAAMAIASPHLVRVLAPASSVPGESVKAVAWILAIMSLGLVPLGASVMMKQAYFALEDARTVFLIHIPMTVAWLAVAYSVKATMDPVWWVRGVALGLVATNIVAVVLRLWGLNKRLGGVDLRRITITHAKAAVAAVLAAVVGLAIVMLGPHSWNQDGASAVLTSAGMSALIGVAMFAVYAVASKLLHIEETTAVARAVTRRLRRVR